MITKSLTLPKKELEESEISTPCHITAEEASTNKPLFDENVKEALPIFKVGDQAMIDELKEVNLGKIESPQPIFVSA